MSPALPGSPLRVLVVHHGRRPVPGAPAPGAAIRAQALGDGIAAAGFAVVYLTRAADAPGGFDGAADLRRKAAALRPDRVVCVQAEDAPALAGLGVPLAVDLYAPRLLEAPFEGTLAAEAPALLRAIAAADVLLVSNPRARLVWLGVLALAGLDTRTDPTLLVPLAAPAALPVGAGLPAPAADPVIVAGGAAWPWQDPVPALEAALAVLDARGAGRIDWYGGPPVLGAATAAWSLPAHPRLRCPGWVGLDAFRRACAEATLAFDLMAPNPERAASFSFRHTEYLGAGLPVLTGPDTALADVLGGAGWLAAPADAGPALAAALDDPALPDRRAAARALADTLHPARAAAPLAAWLAAPVRHPRGKGPLHGAATALARAAADRGRAALREADAARLQDQVHTLLGTVDRLTRALDEVAGFKREAVTLLGHREEAARLDAAALARENALLRADVEKKSAELLAADQLRARLENDIAGLRREVAASQRRGLFPR